jgi:excisionase family DNA binding protein
MPRETSLAAPPARCKLSVPQVAARYGVGEDKVRAWIHAGELRAFNAATRRGGRPRWLIDLADLVAFEQARAATTAPKGGRRRRAPATGIIEYF